MKNIIVGIDFSKNSINSLRHAVAIALKTSATLHLVWVKTPGVTKGLGKGNRNDFVKIANEKLEKLINDCKKEAPNAKIQSVILEGKPFVELTKYAANLDDVIIAIGTHGVSGFEENFIGSNAYRTAAASSVPVLVLREGVNVNRDLVQIVVPVDVSFDTLQKIRYATEFAKVFSAKILLVGIYEKHDPQQKHIVNIQLNHAKLMCTQVNVRHDTEFLPYQGNMANTFVKFAKSKDANLLVIMRENSDQIDITNLFLGNTTQQLLTKSPLPLLIIPNVSMDVAADMQQIES